MNVGDIITRVRRTFGDEAGVQLTDDDIIRWINDAQEHIVLRNEGLMEATAVANTVQGTSDYPTPVDMSVLRSLQYQGYRLQGYSQNDFDNYISGYNAPGSLNGYGQGIPICYKIWNDIITLFPTPSESVTSGLTIFYIKHPTPVALSTDTPSVPLEYHNALVDFCLQQAYELDEDPQKVSLKEGQFEKKVMQLNDRNKWTHQDVYPSITTLPGDEGFGSGIYGGWYGF